MVGKAVDKFDLIAFDFGWVCGTAAHRMFQSMKIHHLPLCMASWVFKIPPRPPCLWSRGILKRRRPGAPFSSGTPSWIGTVFHSVHHVGISQPPRRITQASQDAQIFAVRVNPRRWVHEPRLGVHRGQPRLELDVLEAGRCG